MDVSNYTNPVIAMEVTVAKAAHCSPYHSDSNVSSLCVDLLMEQITRYRPRVRSNYRVRAWARLYCQDPSHFREINNLPRA